MYKLGNTTYNKYDKYIIFWMIYLNKKLIQINKKNQMEKWAKEVNILFTEERPKGW